MTCFQSLFEKTKGKPINWNGKKLYLSHHFSVSKGDIIEATIESTKHFQTQGINIDISGTCEINGKFIDIKKGNKQGANLFFWEDDSPLNIILTVFPQNDSIIIMGARKWDLPFPEETKRQGYIVQTDLGYQYDYSSAMWMEKIQNGWRYHCCHNLYDPKTQNNNESFDHIVFSVKKIGNIYESK